MKAMKAIVYTRYGSPEVILIKELEQPVPRDNEVLIKVHEALVTPSDMAMRTGSPFLVRFFSGLLRPRSSPGTDFAGEVVAVGKDVKRFRNGDRVFGAVGSGAHADYLCVPEDGVLTTIPETMTYRETAGACDAAMTALSFLRDHARIRKGQAVLINGASGSVGTFAVQLARYYGAEVTGVCSGANAEMVKSLGAGKVIDYTREDFNRTGQTYDIIFDAVGKSTFGRCKGALRPGGIYLTTVPSLNIMLQMARTALSGDKKAVFAATGLNQTREKLDFIKALMETGELKSVIDRCYPLEQMAEAHRYVETGRKKGNVVVLVGDEDRRYQAIGAGAAQAA